MVFAGLFPIDADDYEDLRTRSRSCKLNDASFTYEPETCAALGFGFRCGFLGLLHMEIVQERLEREYDLNLITTAPTRALPRHAARRRGDARSTTRRRCPTSRDIERIEEPIDRGDHPRAARVRGRDPDAVPGAPRHAAASMHHHGSRVQSRYELPLAEVVFDFHDQLKSVSRGYASIDYELIGYRPADLVKLDMLVNGEPVDALSLIVHREQAYHRGRDLVRKLKEFIPRQQYEVAIQAAIGGKIIARTTVRALRKNVTAKCYGGDISRKRKLLEKQKEGKKRMKQVGNVEIPQEAFLAALRLDDD